MRLKPTSGRRINGTQIITQLSQNQTRQAEGSARSKAGRKMVENHIRLMDQRVASNYRVEAHPAERSAGHNTVE